MMKLSLFDAHCDTAYELYRRQALLDHNECHVSLERACVYDHYAQYYAVWSDKRLDDEACWQAFLRISDYFLAEVQRLSDRILPIASGDDLERATQSGKNAALLAVEDARLIAGKLERLDELKARGVTYLTLLWGGDTCIGGSHDTPNGLTDLGKAVVHGCLDRGILPDVSHASLLSTEEVLEIAGLRHKPIIASHSNAYAIHPHTRNLRDGHFAAIRELGGIVGISLCPSHLCDPDRQAATAETVFAHVEHYMALGGEDMVGFGADWDGTHLPSGFSGVSDLMSVAEVMAMHNYTDTLIHKLFWQNMYDFALKNL